MPQEQERMSRFKREKIRLFSLQERDIAMIKEVYKYRFLTSEHIAALVGGSKQVVLRRLQLLYHGAYLDRPREQIKPYTSGSNAMVYGLGNKGIDLLVKDFNVKKSKVDWTSKNREVKTVFLEHTLEIANFMVCLRLACQAHGDIELLEPRPRDAGEAFSWKVKISPEIQGKKRDLIFSIVPDRVFQLYFPNHPEGKQRAYFFLEADRSTMPVIRTNLYKTSFFKKMLGYWHSWQEGLFEKTFGFKNARVLTITKSEARIKSLIEANKEVDGRKKGTRMFLFAQGKSFTLADPGQILAQVWQNGRDSERVSLLD